MGIDFPPEDAGFSPEAGDAVNVRTPEEREIWEFVMRAPPLWSLPHG